MAFLLMARRLTNETLIKGAAAQLGVRRQNALAEEIGFMNPQPGRSTLHWGAEREVNNVNQPWLYYGWCPA